MTVDWCPNRRQKFWTGSLCCHDRGTNKARTAKYDSEDDVILAKEPRDRPRMAAGFGLRHGLRAVKSLEMDLSFFGLAGFEVSHPHAVRQRERIVQTVGWDK